MPARNPREENSGRSQSAALKPLNHLGAFCRVGNQYHFRVSDFTVMLQQIEAGDGQAANQLLPLVYDELRQLAAVKDGA